jgi:hypothetical protein
MSNKYTMSAQMSTHIHVAVFSAVWNGNEERNGITQLLYMNDNDTTNSQEM